MGFTGSLLKAFLTFNLPRDSTLSSDFERIKSALDIQTEIVKLTSLQMKGKHLEHCPDCGGHGCFAFFQDVRTFKCYQCDWTGDIFGFLERYENLTTGEALKRAAELAGIALDPPRKKKAEPEPTVRERIFAAASAFYNAQAFTIGREYFFEIRKHNERTVKYLEAGFTNGNGLTKHLSGLGYTDAQLLDTGLVKQSTNGSTRLYDFFWKPGAVLTHKKQGNVVNFTFKPFPVKDKKKDVGFGLEQEFQGDWICHNQDVLYKHGDFTIVEGMNDEGAVMNAGTFDVIGLTGQPSPERIKAICRHASKRNIYICTDNDKAGYDYVRKLAPILTAEGGIVRIVTVPDPYNDIDDYLREFQGDTHREWKRLQGEASDLLTWEIMQAGKLPDLAARRNHLKEKGVFKSIVEMQTIDREIIIEKIEKTGFSKAAIDEAIEKEVDLISIVRDYVEDNDGNKRKFINARLLSESIFKWFLDRGKFFRTDDGRLYLFYNREIFEIKDNENFNYLMLRLSQLHPAEDPGKKVFSYLATLCHGRGERVCTMVWHYTNINNNTIFLGLNSPNNMIVKLTPGEEPAEIPNGINSDSVLLMGSEEIKPFKYQEKVNVQDAFDKLRELIFDNLTCNSEDRYFVICWMISFIFLDYLTVKGIAKFEGDSGFGKSSAADMLVALIYGSGSAGQATGAAARSDAATNPLMVLDNLESDKVKQYIDMLLQGADSRARKKRMAGSDRKTISETMEALTLVTAIEPFSGRLAEIITRTFILNFSLKEQKKGFIKMDIIHDIIRHRDMMLSGIMKMVSMEVLPNLGRRSNWMSTIENLYPDHNKKRANECICMLAVILEAVTRYIPVYSKGIGYGKRSDASHILTAWIRSQDALAEEVNVSSNTIINFLDGIRRGYEIDIKERNISTQPVKGFPDNCYVHTHPAYQLDFIITQGDKRPIEIDGVQVECLVKTYQFDFEMRDLMQAFNSFAKENGIKNPYTSPNILAKRIHNDRETIEKSGWKLVSKDKDTMHNRFVNGTRIFRFMREIVANS